MVYNDFQSFMRSVKIFNSFLNCSRKTINLRILFDKITILGFVCTFFTI